jgi:chromate reductase
VSARPPFAVLSIAGSLRRNSFNRHLLNAAAARAPRDLSISIFAELGAVPLFNEDFESGGGPEPVQRLRDAVARADALLIATPEYNQSLPGVMKNIVDWLSRSEPDVLAGKPTAIFGATQGNWGTRLAQAALRQPLTACGALLMSAPQLYIGNVAGKIDGEGRLVDERTSASLAAFLESFTQWIRALRAQGQRQTT